MQCNFDSFRLRFVSNKKLFKIVLFFRNTIIAYIYQHPSTTTFFRLL